MVDDAIAKRLEREEAEAYRELIERRICMAIEHYTTLQLDIQTNPANVHGAINMHIALLAADVAILAAEVYADPRDLMGAGVIRAIKHLHRLAGDKWRL